MASNEKDKRRTTLDYLVKRVNRPIDEIEGALSARGYIATEQGRITAFNEERRRPVQIRRPIVVEALLDHFSTLNDALEPLEDTRDLPNVVVEESDSLLDVIDSTPPPINDQPAVGRAGIKNKWDIPPPDLGTEKKHPDIFEYRTPEKIHWGKLGKRVLVCGAFLASIVGGYFLNDYVRTTEDDSQKTKIAELQQESDRYKSKLTVERKLSRKLRKELSSSDLESQRISLERLALSDLVSVLDVELSDYADMSFEDWNIYVDGLEESLTAANNRNNELAGEKAGLSRYKSVITRRVLDYLATGCFAIVESSVGYRAAMAVELAYRDREIAALETNNGSLEVDILDLLWDRAELLEDNNLLDKAVSDAASEFVKFDIDYVHALSALIGSSDDFAQLLDDCQASAEDNFERSQVQEGMIAMLIDHREELVGELNSLYTQLEQKGVTIPDFTELTELCEGLDSSVLGYQKTIKECEFECTALRTEVEAARELLNASRNDIAGCQGDNLDLTAENEGLEYCADDLYLDLQEKRAKIELLEEAVASLTGEISSEEVAAYDSLVKQYKALEGDLSQLQRVVDKLRAESNSASISYSLDLADKDATIFALTDEKEGLERARVGFWELSSDIVELENNFVINPYEQITEILDGLEEDRANDLRNLVLNYLRNRTVDGRIVVDGNNCNVALGNLYDTLVGDVGDKDVVARTGFVTYAQQFCKGLDPEKSQTEFMLKK